MLLVVPRNHLRPDFHALGRQRARRSSDAEADGLLMLAPRDCRQSTGSGTAAGARRSGASCTRRPAGCRALRTTVDQTPWISSYFAFQGNNPTRRFEYPWAFHATPLRAGMTALEIGGSLAGFQFVLDKCGLKVSNCDPGNASDSRWPLVPDTIARLNRTFGTSVQLYNCFLQDARLPAASFDRVFSISTIEHFRRTIFRR